MALSPPLARQPIITLSAIEADRRSHFTPLETDLMGMLDHPGLRELQGEIEDSASSEGAVLRSILSLWQVERDALIARAKGVRP